MPILIQPSTIGFFNTGFFQPRAANAVAIFPFYQIPFRYLISITPILTNIKNENPPPEQPPHYCVSPQFSTHNFASLSWFAVEPLQVDWLIGRFNAWFAPLATRLVRAQAVGRYEPEYLAKTGVEPAKIVFAHGFFASGLHEISHWCVAGKRRRQLDDFGYWYAPDGRNAAEQQAFEQVEIKPQAIECLLTLMCGKKFRVSQDNLAADFDTSNSTFATDVREQVLAFFADYQQNLGLGVGEKNGENAKVSKTVNTHKLPSDAKFLLAKLQQLRPFPLTDYAILHNFLSAGG